MLRILICPESYHCGKQKRPGSLPYVRSRNGGCALYRNQMGNRRPPNHRFYAPFLRSRITRPGALRWRESSADLQPLHPGVRPHYYSLQLPLAPDL